MNSIRAKTQESLHATSKIPCGCCNLMFLYVNLPMKVSRKAIMDLRIKWSGKLTSQTVFNSNSNIRELTNALAINSSQEKHGSGKGKKRYSNFPVLEKEQLYSVMPRCYDEIAVCVFCAQFFDEPGEYRPSFSAITYHERRSKFLEQKQREREYWDPLKMLEDDRKALELLEEEQLKVQQQQQLQAQAQTEVTDSNEGEQQQSSKLLSTKTKSK